MALVGVVGGISVAVQAGPGLFVVAFIVVAILLWNLWDAWVLLMGVADEEIAKVWGSKIASRVPCSVSSPPQPSSWSPTTAERKR
jgi:hypothetical protein